MGKPKFWLPILYKQKINFPMNYAPILIFVYNRPDLLEKTLAALAANNLISQSELFVFSDGPKNSGDEKKVALVRKLINEIRFAKNVNVILRENNLGLAKSIIAGVSEVFEKFEKLIVLEDDLITSPGFVEFMNQALTFYSGAKNIYSISGYSQPSKIKDNLLQDIYFSPRAGSWGWGTWKDRWEQADWEVKDFEDFKRDSKAQKKFNAGGEDLSTMLKAQMKGYINSWAVRWCYTLYKNNGLCLYPKKSKVKHIGNQAGATNFSGTSKFDVEIDSDETPTDFTNEIFIDENVVAAINNLFKPSLARKAINFIKYDLIK